MGYIGMCRCKGYGFQAVYAGIGYINQRVWLQSIVSFSKKLINWLKILVKTRETGLIKNIKISGANIKSVLFRLDCASDLSNFWKTATLGQRGFGEFILTSVGQQNSLELALVQAKGSRVLAAHSHPKIPKVLPPTPTRANKVLCWTITVQPCILFDEN